MTGFRETGRIRVDLPCVLRREDGAVQKGILLDIGLGGGRVEVEAPYAPGGSLILEVEDLRLPGRVKRREASERGWVVALEWWDLPPERMGELARWVGAQPRVASFDEEP